MLLSTDWFFPYWPIIGIIAGDERGCFQQGCREIFRELIAGARDYYSISFSVGRIEATGRAVQILARKCRFSPQACQRIDELCTPNVSRDDKQTIAWMFSTLLDELLGDQQLDETTQAVLLRAQEHFAFDFETLEQCCAQSQTEWDAYIRQLTPDLPTTLSDFVSVGLVPEAQLDFVLQQLDRIQRSVLLNHYRTAMLKTTGLSESELPDGWL